MNDHSLFTPFQFAGLELSNRMVMAPMTRGRAELDGTPNDLMAEYYGQRSTAGLIITEATSISPQGTGWFGAPGIYTDAHVEGWRKVTEAVHREGGKIFTQLWHMGRVSHPFFQGGKLPVGPSAIAAKGEAHLPSGNEPYVTPRPLETSEIPAIVEDYARATRRAREAGFDGVELHAANGYLIDQFLRDGSNQRQDRYGGTIPNRARFLLEVAEASAAAWSPTRVGVRLSPLGQYNDMKDSNPRELFTYAAEQLNELELAFLHVSEALPGHWSHVPGEPVWPHLREVFKAPFIINGGYDATTAHLAISTGKTDLVGFGTPFLANPDLVERFRTGTPLNPPDAGTFYSRGREGYIDYPAVSLAA